MVVRIVDEHGKEYYVNDFKGKEISVDMCEDSDGNSQVLIRLSDKQMRKDITYVNLDVYTDEYEIIIEIIQMLIKEGCLSAMCIGQELYDRFNYGPFSVDSIKKVMRDLA